MIDCRVSLKLILGVCNLFVVVDSFGQMTAYGDAIAQPNNCYRLTPDDNNEVGAIWSDATLDISESFDMTAEVYLGTSDNNGGDGMAFVLRAPGSAVMQPNNPPGNNGQYMGFAQIEPSLIVEIDTDRNNSADDPDVPRDHLALQRDGNPDHDSPDCLVQPVAAIPPNVNIEDDEFHVLRVQWDAVAGVITVWFDCLLRFSQAVDLEDILGGTEAIYGFTASTYEEENEHRVCNIQFIEEAAIQLDDALICEGESITLTVPVTLQNVQWSPSAGLNTDQGTTVIATPSTTTVYTVTYDGLCNELESESVEIVVETAPGGVADAAFELCNSAPVVFDLDLLPPGYTVTFGPDEESLPVTVDAAGLYDWQVTTPNGCAFDYTLDVIDVVVNAVDLGDDFALCVGESVMLVGDVQNPGAPVVWNGVIPGNTLLVTQPGWIEVEVGYPNCSVTDELEVTLAPVYESGLPNVAILCFLDEVTLDATDGTWGGSPPSFTWNTGAASSVIQVDIPGTYTVEISAEGCEYTEEIEVQPSAIANVDLGENQQECDGETAVFNSGYTAAQTSWWFNGLPVAAGSTFYANETGTLEVAVTDGFCTATDEVEVTVVEAFDAELPAQVSFCEGSGVQLIAANGADAYAWSNGDAGIYGWAEASGVLTLETTLDGCVFTHAVQVEEWPTPQPDLGEGGSFCAGETVELSTGIANPDWVQWNGQGGGNTFEVTQSGTVMVEVSVNGCVGSDVVNVAFIPIPEFELGPHLTRCPNEEVLLQAGPFASPTTVLWNGTSSGVTHTASESGWYTATATSGQCQFSDSVYVAFDEPITPLLAAEQHKCLETDLVLDASEGIGDHLFPVSYLWETGDYDAVVVLDHAGEYGLTIYNACESVGMEVTVNAIDCGCNIFVPSAFTPDNDGHNDRFIPIIGCTPDDYELVIVNRWGEEVFKTNDVSEGWLGERQGGKDYFGNLDLYHWKLTLVWRIPESAIPRHEYRSGVVSLLR